MPAPRSALLALALTSTVLTVQLPPSAASASDAHPGSSKASRTDPAGNNGTVKVDGVPVDGSRRNEPHVGCDLALKFYGFDRGQTATITFSGQAPTKAGTLLTDGPRVVSDDAAGGGRDADAVLVYSASQLGLSSVTPTSQGWHIKVAVDVAGAPGGAKQKVLWLSCPSSSGTAGGGTTATPTPSATPAPSTSGGGATSLPTTAPTRAPASGASPTAGLGGTTGGGGAVTASTQLLAGPSSGEGVALTYGGGRVSAGAAAPGRSGLPFTGDHVGAAAELGLAALVTGAGALLLGRRRRA